MSLRKTGNTVNSRREMASGIEESIGINRAKNIENKDLNVCMNE